MLVATTERYHDRIWRDPSGVIDILQTTPALIDYGA